MPQMHTLVHGQLQIEYRLVFEHRTTLQVSVFPDADVIVRVPEKASLEEIEKKLKRKARWIVKQQSFFSQFAPKTPPRSFVGGETHLYLGRQYRLKLSEGPKEMVKLDGGEFLVTLKGNPESVHVKSAMEKWYRQRAEEVYTARFESCWMQFRQPELPKPNISIRKMKTRWGSLSPAGLLTLNVELIKAPKACLDYVITHELCHLIHPRHDSGFYKLLESKMPNWKKLKHKLELSLV